jgi:hypothetical protein
MRLGKRPEVTHLTEPAVGWRCRTPPSIPAGAAVKRDVSTRYALKEAKVSHEQPFAFHASLVYFVTTGAPSISAAMRYEMFLVLLC